MSTSVFIHKGKFILSRLICYRHDNTLPVTGENDLSGTLPMELGRLNFLISLETFNVGK